MTHFELIVRIPIKIKNMKVSWDLKCDVGGWRAMAGLGCDLGRTRRARTNQRIRSPAPPFLQTLWLRVITISELCFVSLGHQLWASPASQTFRLLALPSARVSGTVESARWVWRSHTLRCTNECRLLSALCICIFAFLARPVGAV